ncbi:Arabinoxylan arabinofuranohydrolase [Pleurostoma richardsiae]|uniref:Arabinoxylan arabinofuranohydrolase n=1 Tax=Pleurostoma richardsiae TaxID=41990 RepID=A0AA38RLU3_9PEZI|nr:Arabinoxylan arabinofuranohydrolase [Pleurostoma richardsiae]
MRSLISAASLALAAQRLHAAVPDYTTAEAGNPIVDGWYADPDTAIYDGLYWVYPTSSYPYDEQTYLDAFSSSDLVNWTKHPNVLTTANFTWATRAVWAPAPVSRNGKYYLYFAANGIQSDSELGGFGVGVADRPEGRYIDAIGAPLIGAYHNGAQPIDQDVFVDDGRQAYIYYGGHSHANVALLNEDMISLGTLPDGTQFREITPTNYVEGPQMFKLNGTYYMMWSEGGWTGPDYAVSYAMSDLPLGPFDRVAKILQQDSAVATGSGHNGVMNVPGTDIWYIVYHRRPLSETDGNHRVVCYDRMYLNDDGTIEQVTMLVKDNFENGNMIGWKTYGGSFPVADGQLVAASSAGGKALVDTNFTNFIYDADVTVTSGAGDAAVVFRATSLSTNVDAYAGYYAGISTGGTVVLGKADGGWTQLGLAAAAVTAADQVHMRVVAVGSTIEVFVEDMVTPKISVTDSTYINGADGVRVFLVMALFDNISVQKI